MIVFSFMQEDSRTGENYLVTNVFENYQDLYDKWLDDFMSWDLCEYDYDNEKWVRVSSKKSMKDILCHSLTDEHYLAHNGTVYYTFSCLDTSNYDQEYFKEQRDLVERVKSRKG